MERVVLDMIGPFPRSEKGNVYMLSAIDYYTKWPEAYTIPDQAAETVAYLVKGMFSRFGVPDTLHNHQGRNFESCVFSSMCSRLGIHTEDPYLPFMAPKRWSRGETAHWASSWPS